MRTLRPARPEMAGPDVRDAQWALGNNRFGNWFPWQPNAIFGPRTGQATKAAKYWLGYRMAGVNKVYGPTLHAYLTGRKRLPLLYRQRRQHRLKLLERPTYSFPLSVMGDYIGYPGQGTHSWVEAPNNWESDNAVDIAARVGTPVLAIEDGKVTAPIGPLGSRNPAMAGIRLHFKTPTNEFYYAHLSRLEHGIHVGKSVYAGDVLGYSGSANGVPHLHFAVRTGHPLGLIARAKVSTPRPPFFPLSIVYAA